MAIGNNSLMSISNGQVPKMSLALGRLNKGIKSENPLAFDFFSSQIDPLLVADHPDVYKEIITCIQC